MPTLKVELPDCAYAVTIEHSALDQLGGIVRAAAPHTRAALIVDDNIADTHGPRARESLESAGYDCAVCTLTARESEKSMAALGRIHDHLLVHKLERTSPVIALGGGIVGDIAGFAAATYLRGVPVIQVPTTMLAMVDASIGGKTGVNCPLPPDDAGRATLGKNLIGAFWQPRAVVADPAVLATLPDRELRCGLAESIKHGMINNAPLLDFLHSHADAILNLEPETLTAFIARSASIKIGIVQKDVRESGRRALLNLGHTFAHAFESFAELDLKHGEAVAVGLNAAALCAHECGLLAQPIVDEYDAILLNVGLPTRINQPIPADRLLAIMSFDKKAERDRLRLILPVARGKAEIHSDIPDRAILAALRAVGAG